MLICVRGLENNALTYLINNLQNQRDKDNNMFENLRQTSYVNDDTYCTLVGVSRLYVMFIYFNVTYLQLHTTDWQIKCIEFK